MQAQFTSFSLEALATAEGMAGKADRSSFDYNVTAESYSQLLRYNVRDCEIVLELCQKRRIVESILSTCIEARCPFVEVALYNTGIIGSCALASGAFRFTGRDIAWVPTSSYIDNIAGGQLLFDRPMIASNVIYLDYNSLYPSIISATGISPERCNLSQPTRSAMATGECMVDWHTDSGSFCFVYFTSTFPVQ